MYQDYFGFREPPFTLTPNPEFLFLSRCHQEAYAHLLYAIESRAGFIELSGEVGTGKTTIVRTLLSQLAPETYRSALIFNPTLSPTGLLQEINREFGIFSASNEARELHQALNELLLKENGENRTVVLVIDEAQNLSRDVLEQVRLISNLETEREKLIQIVLVGQPELRDILAREDLRQLRQRITVRYHLDRMDEGDIHSYIRHRIRIAAEGKEPVTFTRAAVKRIARYSKGLPRLINALCDRAILLAYTKDSREISAQMAAAAIADLSKETRRSPVLLLVIASLLLILIVSLFFISPGDIRQTKQATAPPPVASAVPPTELKGGVKLLQEMLKTAGHYSGAATGVFDRSTEEGVRSFQGKEGLTVDGRPGGQTLMRLYQKTGGKFSPLSSAVVNNEGVSR
jgi:general secretion pathway protein A